MKIQYIYLIYLAVFCLSSCATAPSKYQAWRNDQYPEKDNRQALLAEHKNTCDFRTKQAFAKPFCVTGILVECPDPEKAKRDAAYMACMKEFGWHQEEADEKCRPGCYFGKCCDQDET